MKKNLKRLSVFVAGATAGLVAFSGCAGIDGLVGKTNLPDLDINWAQIQTNITQEKLREFGWYVDDLQEEIDEFGTVSFYNYEPSELNAFKQVDYQFYVQYGVGYEYENEQVVYYEVPVYEVMLVDNASKQYYSAVYNDYSAKKEGPFELMKEEGVWFLEEDQAEYIEHVLHRCRYFVVGRYDVHYEMKYFGKITS
jgi:hypothetical protein